MYHYLYKKVKNQGYYTACGIINESGFIRPDRANTRFPMCKNCLRSNVFKQHLFLWELKYRDQTSGVRAWCIAWEADDLPKP